jgi:NTE family protein
MRSTNLPSLALVGTLLAGCTAHYPLNEPHSPVVAAAPSVSLLDVGDARSNSLLVGLAFSGGGTRAAAFSYGVLETLADARIRWDGRERRLLDEIDAISSVSGGSYTAGYYGHFGDRIFEDYADKFLNHDVQGHLTWSLFSPVSWGKLGSSQFDRSDLAAEYYDEILFEGKTFGDVLARNGPRLNINATEIALGAQFTFDPAQFALICSDYGSFPISRAVTASSAVPILFSSVILRNYAGTCPFQMPPWAQAAEKSADPTSRAYHLVKQLAKYADREELPYIHLYDGGLTDNLGVRPFINRLTLSGGSWELAKAMGAADTHRMLVIVVNAQSEMNVEFRQSEVDLSLGEAITASTSIPLNEYTFDSLSLFRLALDGVASQMIKNRCADWATTRESTEGCDDFKIYFVEVDFDKLTDSKRSQTLKHLPTSFVLTVDEVDDLRAAAREIMTDSKDFQRFMRDMDGRWSPRAAK